MTRYFLSRVKIEGFRGINNESDPLELKFSSDAVNSVFAVNGVGKSSIYEALCYAIKGSIPKLDGLQAQERAQDYYSNRFHSTGTASIELELLPDDGTAAVIIWVQRDRLGNRRVTSPSGCADPEGILAQLNQDFALLDYQTFSRFIDSSPLDRGRSFSSLLGLSSYSDLRQALQAVTDTRAFNADFDVNASKSTARAAEAATQTALRRIGSAFTSLTGQPFADVSALNSYTTLVLAALARIELIKDKVQGLTLEEIDFDAIKEAIRTAEGGERRRELEKVIQTIADLEALGEAIKVSEEQTSFKELLVKRDELLARTRGDRFKNLLEAAEVIVSSGEWNSPQQCPLCDSKLGVSIVDLVGAHLREYEEVSSATDRITTAWQEAAWVTRLRQLEEARALKGIAAQNLTSLLDHKIEDGGFTVADFETAVAGLAALENARAERLRAAKGRKADLDKELPPSLVALHEQVEYGRQFCEALDEYSEKKAELDAVQKALTVVEHWRKFVSTAAVTFADAEAALAGEKIKDIGDDYKDLFKRIMGVSDVVPDLKRDSTREDLYVHLADFHGLSGLSARALLSESYRNALAISVFLAAAQKNVGAPRFVVLDDVTSSFDSGHQWNLMEAIRVSLQQPRRGDGLQFVILSHDGLLEKYFDKIGNSVGWNHQKLQGWPPLGAVMANTQDGNRLKSTATRFLNAGQVSEAEPLIRQYLEFKLMQIIEKVRIPVPLDFAIKDHKKMVSNCLDAINAALDLQKKAGTLVLTPAQIAKIDSTCVPALVGNWVSHYETASASSLSPPVLLGVLQTIDDFADCFQYTATVSGSPQKKWYSALDKK